MTSHLRLFIFLLIVSFLGLSACSNSLTTRGENQSVQSIDEAFPDIDEDVAQVETDDMSDEGVESFEDFDSDAGESIASESLDLDDEMDGVTGDVASNEIEDFSDFDFESEDADVSAGGDALDLEDGDALDLEDGDDSLDKMVATPTAPETSSSNDPFAAFDDVESNSDSSAMTGDFSDFEGDGPDDLVTKDAGVSDPFADMMSEDLEVSDSLTSDFEDGNSIDAPAVADTSDRDPIFEDGFSDSTPSQETAFEKDLDDAFTDTLDSPIDDDVLLSSTDQGRNTLTVLEYNAQSASGTVVLKAEQALEFTSQYDPASSQFILNLHNITVPSILQRPLYLKDFKQSFGAVKATPISGGLVQVIVKVTNRQEPNILTNGKELLISPGTEAITGKVSTVSPNIPIDPNGNVEAQISKNLNIPMTLDPAGEKSLTASSLEEFLLETGTFYGDNITLQVSEEEVTTVIGFIADYSGANIVIAPGVSGKVTLKLRNVPWDQALLTIMKTKGLGYVRTGNVLRIAPLEDLQKEAQAAVEVRKSQVQVEPTILKIIPLEYATSEEILTQVIPFLTKDRGTATQDKRTSSIILNDTKTVINKVSKLVKELDIPPPQVLVEAKIVEATKTFARNIGVRWGASGFRTQIAPSGGANNQAISISPSFQVNNTLEAQAYTTNQPFLGGINFGVLDFFGSLDAAIGLSETDELVRVISSPRVTTLNNVEAVITQSSEIIRLQTIITPGSPAQITPIAIPMDLQLKVTPQITSGSSVLMQLDVKNEFPGAPIQGQSPKNSRSASAKVLVETNKTAVIGGIFDKRSTAIEIGVPMLKNIPLIGWLFRTKGMEKRDTEVMIFVTPRILDKNYQTTSSSKL